MRGRGTKPVAASPDLQHLTLQELRAYRAELREEEMRVSYWRRLVQGRIDILRARQGSLEPLTVAMLVTALRDTGTGKRRGALLNIYASDELPDLPGLQDVWTAGVDRTDERATEEVLASLRDVEARLSEYRSLLFSRLDAATSDLIVRYQENPKLCLDLTA